MAQTEILHEDTAAPSPKKRGRHWSRWTWVVAVVLLVGGVFFFDQLGRRASLDTGLYLALAYYLGMTVVLAVLGAVSVRRRAGTAATTAALFVVAMVALPAFTTAAVRGAAVRAATAVDEFFGEAFGDSSTTPGDGDAPSSDYELEGELPDDEQSFGAQTFGDDPELDELWTACENENAAACSELYFMSPAGSEYESFGESCGGRVQTGVEDCNVVFDDVGD